MNIRYRKVDDKTRPEDTGFTIATRYCKQRHQYAARTGIGRFGRD